MLLLATYAFLMPQAEAELNDASGQSDDVRKSAVWQLERMCSEPAFQAHNVLCIEVGSGPPTPNQPLPQSDGQLPVGSMLA